MSLTKYQKFEVETIKRSQINKAPYNPRMIGDDAAKRLRRKIAKVGLIVPLVWNKRSGNLVGGHQRLSQIDKLEKYPEKVSDYDITVSVCDLDDRTEKEMVVFLNNPSSQGEWDIDALADLALSSEIDFKDMGFTESDVDFLFEGDSRFSELFQDTEEVKKAKADLQDIKKERSEYAEKIKGEQSANFYFIVVCESQENKNKLLKKIGVPLSEEYVLETKINNALKDELHER